MKRSWVAVWVAMAWTALVLLSAPAAEARESVAQLAKKLGSSDDFRVRTQAALALGASGSKKAVKPLCGGLDDKSDTVRAAAAAALGRLQQGGGGCLKKRLKRETKSNVKKMINKAIRLVEEAAASPGLSRSTRYYIALGRIEDNSGRSGDVTKLVRSSLLKAANRYGKYVFAPPGETVVQARKRLRKYPQVLAFYMEPVVSVRYFNGKLTVRFELKLAGYPEKTPQGFVTRTGGYSPVDDKDSDRENELIEKLATSAMREFNKMAAQVD